MPVDRLMGSSVFTLINEALLSHCRLTIFDLVHGLEHVVDALPVGILAVGAFRVLSRVLDIGYGSSNSITSCSAAGVESIVDAHLTSMDRLMTIDVDSRRFGEDEEYDRLASCVLDSGVAVSTLAAHQKGI